MILSKMGSSVPEAERPHFLPLTENEAAWRAVAHYARPDDAYVFLVDGAGVVQWQSEGAAIDASYTVLKEKLEAVRTHPPAGSGR